MPETKLPLKVALVHDWLIGGGAERVVLELHHMYPDAPIYTSYCTPEWQQKLDGKVVTGWLQHWPFSILRKFIVPLRIWYFTHLDFSGYDLVISSSGAEAKGIVVPAGTVHVNYCHAPTHYYWSRYEEYLKSPGFGPFDGIARIGLKLLVEPLRKWDYQAAQRPNYILANSNHTKLQISRYYGRESVVVHPPVDTERFNFADLSDSTNITDSSDINGYAKNFSSTSNNNDGINHRDTNKPSSTRSTIKTNSESTNNLSDNISRASGSGRIGFVIAGRQTPYKRIDLAVAACTKLSLKLTVIGKGPDHASLVAMAGPTITFVTNASDNDVARYFASAQAFIFPGLDDFGITPVEAMAAGTPVIAYQAGGALDYVVSGKTGEFFSLQTVDSLAAVLKGFDPKNYHSHDIKMAAASFDTENFRQNFQAELKQYVAI